MHSFQSAVVIGNENPGIALCNQLPGASTPNRSAVEVVLSERTSAVVRGLLVVMEHHDAPKVIRQALDQQVHEFADNLENEMVWLKCMKYILTYPLARYLRNELPPSPPKVFTPRGALRKWMRLRLLTFCRANSHLWYSWLQAKRAALPLSEDVIESTYQDHLKTLTKEDEGDESVINEIFEDETFRTVLDKVRKDMTSNLKHGASFWEHSPSTSACFERTRGEGGQFGELLSRAREDPTICGLHHWDLVSMQILPCVFGRTTQHNRVCEIRRIRAVGDWERTQICVQGYLQGEPRATNCTIQAILEPFKVRVISKGETLPYFAVKPIQVAMHSAMRHMDCFRLIGRPFSPTDLLDLVERSDASEEWFSVDYSAATDGLSWKYSGKIFKYLIGNLPREQIRLAMAVLGPHRLHYPTKDHSRVEFRGLQRNGQLMGSTLSFPILCLANLGVYLRTTRSHQQGWTHEQRLRHVLINGDDMLYRAPRPLWEDHIRIGKSVGLNMSVGKAYHHSIYANVNSISVHYKMASGHTPWQIDFLNTGLYFDQHKVADTKESKTSGKRSCEWYAGCRNIESLDDHVGIDDLKDSWLPRSCATNLNVLLKGCLPGKQARVAAQFIRLHKEKIEEESLAVVRLPRIMAKRGPRKIFTTRNIFLPISVGGLGVEPPIGFRFKVTKLQQHIADYKIHSYSAFHTQGMGPVNGYPIKELPNKQPVWWKKSSDVALPMYNVGPGKTSNRVCRIGVQFYACNRNTFTM